MLNSEKTLTNPRLFCKKIEETLKHNTWEKRYMVPSPNLYPYQWNWDSGFVAMGFAHFDLPRAISPKKYMRRSHIIALFWGVVCEVIAFYTRCFLVLVECHWCGGNPFGWVFSKRLARKECSGYTTSYFGIYKIQSAFCVLLAAIFCSHCCVFCDVANFILR